MRECDNAERLTAVAIGRNSEGQLWYELSNGYYVNAADVSQTGYDYSHFANINSEYGICRTLLVGDSGELGSAITIQSISLILFDGSGKIIVNQTRSPNVKNKYSFPDELVAKYDPTGFTDGEKYELRIIVYGKDDYCTEDGSALSSKTFSQTIENYSFTYTHRYVKDSSASVAATCEKSGHIKETCSTCGHVHDEDLPALGHDWTNWAVEQEATANSEGTMVRGCLRCGKIERKPIGLYMSACTRLTSYAEITLTGSSTMKSLPCSRATAAEYDSISEDLLSCKAGDTFTATALIKNSYGNYWYEVSYNGGIGYIYSGDTTATAKYNVSVSGVTAPTGTRTVGEALTLKGIISGGGLKLTKVGARVYAASDTSFSNVLTGKQVSVSADSYSIKGSALDTACKIGSLAEGSYVYRISAKAENHICTDGKTLQTVSKSFPALYESTFTEKKKVSTYSIRYNGTRDGSSPWPETQTKTTGQTVKLSTIVPTLSGYTFMGWGTSINATEAVYQPGDNYKDDKSISLYAVWLSNQVAKAFSVTFHPNGGSGDPWTVESTGENIEFWEGYPERTEYYFVGWNEDPHASEGMYYDPWWMLTVVPYQGKGSVTLYAVWEEKTVTIRYDANGGSSAPPSQEKKWFSPITLSTTIPVHPEGYAFLGWAESKDALTAAYQPGQTYSNSSVTTLYAVWDAYHITYNGDRYGVFDLPPVQYVQGDYFTVSEMIPRYYLAKCVNESVEAEFLGWSTDKNALEPQYYPGECYQISAHMTLYPVWHDPEYVLLKTPFLTYYGYYGATDPDRKVWRDEMIKGSMGGVEEYYIGATTQPGKTLREYGWTLPTWYADNYKAYQETRIMKKSLQLTGWFRVESGQSIYDRSNWIPVTEDLVLNENTTIYPIWLFDAYRVDFDANGGKGAPEHQYKNEGESLILSDTVPVNGDDVFLGWSTDPNAVEAEYQPGDSYDAEDNTVLYAVWQNSVLHFSRFEELKRIAEHHYPFMVTARQQGTDTLVFPEDFTVPANLHVILTDADTFNYTLTVAENAELEIQGKLRFDSLKVDGTLHIGAGSIAEDRFEVDENAAAYNIGSVEMNGTLILDGTLVTAELIGTGTIIDGTGDDGNCRLVLERFASDPDSLVSLLEEAEDAQSLKRYRIYLLDSVSIVNDCTINDFTELRIGTVYNKEVGLDIAQNAALIVETDGVLAVCDGGSVTLNGTLENNGLTRVVPGAMIMMGSDGAYRGSGDILINHQSGEAALETFLPGFDLEAFDVAAFESGSTKLTLKEQNVLASGVCGEQLTWVLTEEGVLKVSGTGNMNNFWGFSPWYRYRDRILTVEIKKGVTSIGINAFQECENMRSISVPSTITTIGGGSFSYCASLKHVTIPAAVTMMDTWAFSDCTNLEEIYVEESNQKYKNENGVVLSKNGKELIACPAGMTGTCTVPEGVNEICGGAFCGCSRLNCITLPDSLRYIDAYAFRRCTGLIEITLPEGLIGIGSAAFMETNLYEIEFPSSLEYCNNDGAGDGVFAETPMKNIYVSPDNPYMCSVEGVVFSKDLSELICFPSGRRDIYRIPEGVTRIGDMAFCNAQLERVILPQSLTAIGECAFQFSYLESIQIPASVTSIENWAVAFCEVSEICFAGSAPAFADSCFLNIKATAYYPDNDPSWTEELRLQYGGDIAWIPYASGDLTGDGEMDAADLMALRKNLVGLKEDLSQVLADLNGDGTVTILDLVRLRKLLVGVTD